MWLSVLTTVIAILLFLDLTWRLWKRKYQNIAQYSNIPWLGSVPFYYSCPHEIYKIRLEHGRRYNFFYIHWLLGIPVVALGRAEYVESLLASREILKKHLMYDFAKEWLGTGLLLSYGQKWKKRRSLLTPAFHFTILNEFVGIYEKYANMMVGKLRALSHGGKCVDVQELASLALLDVICETSMGVSVGALSSFGLKEESSKYAKSVEEIKRLIALRIGSPIQGSQLVYPFTKNGKQYARCLNDIHSFTLDVIEKNIEARRQRVETTAADEEKAPDENKSKYTERKVFIDILLDLYEQGEIDISGIREEVDTFVFEGHDTTASSLSWALYEISKHPEIQEKIYAEICDVSSNNTSMADIIRSLKYLEMVIKETLRLYPAVSSFGRVIERDTEMNGCLFPAGTIMQVDVLNLHRNPAYWTNPDIFDPDRFTSEECAKRSAFCYVPFSAGSRNCIGQKFALQEEKVFLYTILKEFRVVSANTPKPAHALITTSLNGIQLNFHERC